MREGRPLCERDIIEAMVPYTAFMKAYRAGKRGRDLPQLPTNPSDDAPWSVVASFFLHAPLAIAAKLARRCRAHRFLSLTARARLRTDALSFEPRSCGLNLAYTNLGLALLSQRDVWGAIACLDASWRVYPCAHNVSFGLNRLLALALRPYREAWPALEQYNRMSRRFLSLETGPDSSPRAES